jgi:RNA recognition motif-containing protein
MAKGLFKIYVGNLDYKVTEFSVRRLFEPYGEIEDIAMATDKESGKPRGFAIVMMRDHGEAKTAITGVKGRKLMGRDLVVNEAIKKKGSQKTEDSPGDAAASKPGERPSAARSSTSSQDGQYRSRSSDQSRSGRSTAGSGQGGGSGRNPRRGGRNPRRG